MEKHLTKNRMTLLAAMLLGTLGLSGCGKTIDWLFDAPETPGAVRTNIKPPPEMIDDVKPRVAPDVRPRTNPAPEQPAPVAAPDAKTEIRNQLAAWRDAWAGRDLANYLAAYAPGFKGRESSPENWQAGRKRIIGNAGTIELSIGRPEIEQQDADHATATFIQSYRSNNKTDSGTKTLQFRRIDGRWLIEQESFKTGKH